MNQAAIALPYWNDGEYFVVTGFTTDDEGYLAFTGTTHYPDGTTKADDQWLVKDEWRQVQL